MPSNWLYIDTNFPTFTGEESSEEKITTIQNYMFMLVEQLRYSLHNLDLSNMNKTAVERYETSITEPIYARIEDGEENIADPGHYGGGAGGPPVQRRGEHHLPNRHGGGAEPADLRRGGRHPAAGDHRGRPGHPDLQRAGANLQPAADGGRVLPVGIQRGEQLLPVPHQQRLYRLQRPDHLHRAW